MLTPTAALPCRVHKVDPLTASDALYLTTKYVVTRDRFTINNDGTGSNSKMALPNLATAAHGDFFYNKTLAPNRW